MSAALCSLVSAPLPANVAIARSLKVTATSAPNCFQAGGDWIHLLPSGVLRLDVRLTIDTDDSALEKIVDEVLAANAKSVEEFRAGKEKAFNALIGQAMKASKGKAHPGLRQGENMSCIVSSSAFSVRGGILPKWLARRTLSTVRIWSRRINPSLPA